MEGYIMFLKKTPKPNGTYLAITEAYYDKTKKCTRQKTIQGLRSFEVHCPTNTPETLVVTGFFMSIF